MNLKAIRLAGIAILAALVLGAMGCSGEPPGRTNASDKGAEGRGTPEGPAFDPNK